MNKNQEYWKRLLNGEHHVAQIEARLNRIVPSNPRCKICFAPFGGAGGLLYNFFGRRPSTKNPTMCNICLAFAQRHPGGAEVELAMLFADIRGSTTIAEGMTATEFNSLLSGFFKTANDVLIGHNAWIDKFVGDEIIAFFFPNAVPGKHYAQAGLDAARDLLRVTRDGSLPIGIGIHSGTAYVGTVGDDQISDVTAVGDNVNVTARLASAAEARTIVASETLCVAAGLSGDDAERRFLNLKGKNSAVAVRILH